MAITQSGLTVHTQTGTGTWLDIGGGQGSSDSTVNFFSSTSARGRKFSGDRGMMFEVNASGTDLSNTVLQIRWFLTGGFAATRAAGGGSIRIQDTSGNWSEWDVAGSDTYKGGWAISAISTTESESTNSGTAATLTAIRYIGFRFNASGGSGGDPNCFIDQVLSWADTGITATGNTTTLVADLVSWDSASDYGIIESRSGIAFTLASIILAPDVTGISSTDETLVFEDVVYDDGTNVASALQEAKLSSTDSDPITLTRFNCRAADNPDKDGGNTIQRSIDFSSATNLTINTATFSGFDSTINPVRLGNSTNDITGVSFNACGQVTESGAVIRDSFFRNSTDTAGAFLWSSTTDLEDSSFIGNTAGIEHDTSVGSPFAYANLVFSGNTNDVNNSSGNAITINASGTSNPSTSTGSAVTFSNPKTFKFTLNPSIIDYEWRIYEVDAVGSLTGAVELDGEESATQDNQTYSYNYSVDTPIAVQILSQPDEDYEEKVEYYTLTASNQDVNINLAIDNNN